MRYIQHDVVCRPVSAVWDEKTSVACLAALAASFGDMPEHSQQLRTNTGHKRAHPDTEAFETRLDAQSVLVIAQSISHLPAVTESAAKALIPDAEFRLRQIVQDAKKFMSHSKRRFLTTSDINFALRVRNADPVYGFAPLTPTYQQPLTSLPTPSNITSSSPQQPQHPSSANSNPSSSPRASPPPLPTSGSASLALNAEARTSTTDAALAREADGLQSRTDTLPSELQVVPITSDAKPDVAQYVQVSGTPDLFFANDVEHNLRESLKAPLPPVPLEVVINAHWLAIDSVQPKIPQNPAPTDEEQPDDSDVPSAKKRKITHPSKGSASDEDPIKTGKVATVIKSNVKHVLSRELQAYYDYVRRALFSYDVNTIETTLASISTEHGIKQLLPYFTAFVAQAVRSHLKDLPLLLSLMRMVWAMNENTTLSLDKYLHQLLPGLLTCIVGHRLCENHRHNHWALRDYTAELIKSICQRFDGSYSEIKQRMTATFLDAFRPGRNLSQLYGGIVGLAAMGPLVVKQTLIPKAKFVEKIRDVLQSDRLKPARRFEAAKVYCALASAVHNSRRPASDDSTQDEQPNSPTTVPPEEVADLLPAAQQLLPALEAEFGKRVYPLGAAALEEDVMNDIYSMVDKNDARNNMTP